MITELTAQKIINGGIFYAKETIERTITRFGAGILRLGYTEGSMKFYRNRWQKISSLLKNRMKYTYSEQLGIDFVENYFQILEKDFDKTLSQKDTQELRIIRMIGDFQLHHTVLRRYYKHKEILTDSYYIDISNDFKKYCEEKDYSKVTVDHYVKQSERFMDYLVSQGIYDCHDIKLPVDQRLY